MGGVKLLILAYLILWQFPLLFAAGWLAARALRSAGAEAEHRAWVTTLTLQCLLPAGSIFPIDWLRAFSRLSWNASRASHAYVSVTMGGGDWIRSNSTAGLFPGNGRDLVCHRERIFRSQISVEGYEPLFAAARGRASTAHWGRCSFLGAMLKKVCH